MGPLCSLQVVKNSMKKSLLLAGINVPQSDVDQVPGGQNRFGPGEPWDIYDLWWEGGQYAV